MTEGIKVTLKIRSGCSKHYEVGMTNWVSKALNDRYWKG